MTTRFYGIAQYLAAAILAAFIIAAPAHCKATMAQAVAAMTAPRDGAHDFDFLTGEWETHILRLDHPFTGSTTWLPMTGKVVTRKVWDGRAFLEEIQADGPGRPHFESLTLFLYNPPAHQWSINFVNSSDGTLSTPAIGEFVNGRGEFYDQETYQGRAILVRVIWSGVTGNSYHFEQSFSADGGKTWEPNFKADLTRVKS
jgi:hypothetical protein